MRVRRLVLEDFRSYGHVEVELAPGTNVFIGANGAGKTNLLEAIHLVARGDSSRAREDAEMVRWGAALGRVCADLARPDDKRRVEVVLFAPEAGERRRPRRWLLDRAAKRADDAVGELKVVAFFPEDVALLAEAPGARRRYLDSMIGQVDRRHRADARELRRIIERRNAVLRALRESGVPAAEGQRSAELAFWNESLCRTGGSIAHRRAIAVREIAPAFNRAIMEFTAGGTLELVYAAQVDGGSPAERAAGYAGLLEEKGEREVWQGMTLVGPQREDLAVTGAGRPLPAFASRGEHRSAVLALKLAEAEWLHAQAGDAPVFLLDDVLSELDPRRREVLIAALPTDAQVLVTAALPAGLPAALVAAAAVREVTPGRVAAGPA